MNRIILALIFGLGIFLPAFAQSGDPPGAGPLWEDHAHASILVMVHGDKLDFSITPFQLQSSWIHFENNEGKTIHRHASGVTLGYLFETMGFDLTDRCLVFPDSREFCTNYEYSLKFYINRITVSGVSEFVLEEGDQILISYGDENQIGIESQLDELAGLIVIPDWIKDVAAFWCSDEIGDSEFIEAVQFLLDSGVISIPLTDSDISTTQSVPDWIKNNACWWSQDLISDETFALGIQYLIEQGIIKFEFHSF